VFFTMPWPPLPGEVADDTGDLLGLALLDESIGDPITSGGDASLWDGVDLGQDGDQDDDQKGAETSGEAAGKAAVTSGSDSPARERDKKRRIKRKQR
jgi:hypothetical protein